MRALWSFWSKPYLSRAGWHWSCDRTHWLSWALSVETARKHYPDTALVTDRAGARILVEQMGLEFTQVSTDLDALDDADPRWWALGKLYAYAAQRRPFVHIDADVFLWKRLPGILEHAPVLAQSPELVTDGGSYPTGHVTGLLSAHGGWVPPAWKLYMARSAQEAACCGIVGGNDVEFLNHYARTAIDVVLRPENVRAWASEKNLAHYNPLVEQYTLSACAHEWRSSPDAARRDLYVQYLFPSSTIGSAPGYTHLIAHAKRHPENVARVEAVVRRDYPCLYQRCLDLEAPAQEAALRPIEASSAPLAG